MPVFSCWQWLLRSYLCHILEIHPAVAQLSLSNGSLLCSVACKEKSSSCTRLGKEKSSGSGKNFEQQLMPMCIQIQQNEAFGTWLKGGFRCSVDMISHYSVIHLRGTCLHGSGNGFSCVFCSITRRECVLLLLRRA